MRIGRCSPCCCAHIEIAHADEAVILRAHAQQAISSACDDEDEFKRVAEELRGMVKDLMLNKARAHIPLSRRHRPPLLARMRIFQGLSVYI